MRLHTNLQVKVIKMTQCIICRKDTKELSEQYVIPEILCGYYFTNSICDTCYEQMTTNIDRPLIRHKLSQFKIEHMKNRLTPRSIRMSMVRNLRPLRQMLLK